MAKKTKVKKQPKLIVKSNEQLSEIYGNFWEKEFEELSDNEIADFLSANKISYLSKHPEWGNYNEVVDMFNSIAVNFRAKNIDL